METQEPFDFDKKLQQIWTFLEESNKAAEMRALEREKKQALEWEEREKKRALEWEEQEKKRALEWEEQKKKRALEWEEQEKKQLERIQMLDEKTKDSLEEAGRWINDISRNVGGLNNSLGELVEILIGAGLWDKFSNTPYKFREGDWRVAVWNHKNEKFAEIDVLLVDTDYVMAVEVKRQVRHGDIGDHVERMRRIKLYPPKKVKGKKLLGAIAAAFINPEDRDLAFEQGFFVLELNGELVSLTAPPPGFAPKIW